MFYQVGDLEIWGDLIWLGLGGGRLEAMEVGITNMAKHTNTRIYRAHWRASEGQG